MAEKVAEEAKAPAPAIDAAFWFAQSKVLVEGAVARRNEAADRLVEGIKWLWTAYTAGAIVGFAVTDKDYPLWAIVVMAVPTVLLPVAYASAVWIRNPVDVTFDERVPSEIQTAYYKNADEKKKRLRWTLVLGFLGTAAVIAAILTAAFFPKDEAAGMFSAALDSDSAPLELVAAGEFDAGTAVQFTVESRTGDLADSQSKTFVTQPDGDVEARFPVEEAETYVLTAEWTEEKVGTRSLAKEVKGTKPGEEAPNSGSGG